MSDSKPVCSHDWETGRWGVIVGVSRCRICGVRSRSEDFARRRAAPGEQERGMTERPIIFSGDMVRAILDGRKTQTRRVLGFQPLEILTPRNRTKRSLDQVTRMWSGTRTWFALTERGQTVEGNRGTAFRCKYGEVGDRLWVRETFFDHDSGRPMPATRSELLERVEYRATPWDHEFADPEECGPWRSPIHMPRWASRLTLEITEVRVQRVHEISEADARAEGIRWSEPTDDDRAWAQAKFEEGEFSSPDIGGVWIAPGTNCGFGPKENREMWGPNPKVAFQFLWDSINAKRGYGWDANPWVWAITFQVRPPEGGTEG